MMDDELDSTTENVRDCFVYGRWAVGNPERHFAEFDSWLAAHDAELTRQSPASTAAADAWEWGHRHSQGTNAIGDEKRARLEYAEGVARDHRKQTQEQGKNRLVKRRPAGPWIEVAAPKEG
jgi:hypothetical protein